MVVFYSLSIAGDAREGKFPRTHLTKRGLTCAILQRLYWLIHGRNQATHAFGANEFDILFATTVYEVLVEGFHAGRRTAATFFKHCLTNQNAIENSRIGGSQNPDQHPIALVCRRDDNKDPQAMRPVEHHLIWKAKVMLSRVGCPHSQEDLTVESVVTELHNQVFGQLDVNRLPFNWTGNAVDPHIRSKRWSYLFETLDANPLSSHLLEEVNFYHQELTANKGNRTRREGGMTGERMEQNDASFEHILKTQILNNPNNPTHTFWTWRKQPTNAQRAQYQGPNAPLPFQCPDNFPFVICLAHTGVVGKMKTLSGKILRKHNTNAVKTSIQLDRKYKVIAKRGRRAENNRGPFKRYRIVEEDGS